MPRRLLPLAPVAAVLAAALLTSGCAEDPAAAATVNGEVITHDELLGEVAEWAESPTLLAQGLGIAEGAEQGSAPDTYSIELVDRVLTLLIAFEVTDAEFEARGMQLTQADLDSTEENLLGEYTQDLYDEISPELRTRLIEMVTRRVLVEEALEGEPLDADVEVSSRYGEWDPSTLSVIPPDGPRNPAPEPEPIAEL